MREVLFKAKNVATGEWVEGLLWKKKYKSNKIFISCFPDKDDNEEVYVVDENTICQYTGLTDKNGNKIWENDVVRCQDVIGKIGWNETHLSYTILAEVEESMRYYYIDESLSSDIEVIGNTFDNPELLGG